MSDPYSRVKGGKLKLKKGKLKKLKKAKEAKQILKEEPKVDHDALAHAGWWEVKDIARCSGPVVIEMGEMRYVQALDNGYFCLGREHKPGEAPRAEEILVAARASDGHISFKSGFNKYLGISKGSRLTAIEDAISSREQWQPVFQDDKLALLGYNECFLSKPEDDDDDYDDHGGEKEGEKDRKVKGSVYCDSQKAKENEFLKIRSNAVIVKEKTEADNDLGKIRDVELNYVKKFQSFEDRKVKVNPDDVSKVKKARRDGTLHGSLLDRREKMKSDKHC